MSAVLTRVAMAPGADLDGFRAAARRLMAAQVPPELAEWSIGGGDLFGAEPAESGPALMLAKAAAELIRLVVCHADPERYALLYRLIWRLRHGERALMEVASDPLVHRLQRIAKSVRRDIHKMHAFVRFRKVEGGERERFMAWFEPDHFILDIAAPFFVDRFPAMKWAILTPKGSLRWDGRSLERGPPASKADAPTEDDFEAHWLGYYESIFNPARLNPDKMRGEMAVKYWANLPEAALIPRLIREAPERVQQMIDREASQPMRRNPAKAVAAMADQAPHSLAELNRLIAASQPPAPFSARAVLGEGAIGAAIAFVGEQPGDQEDLEGRPFIGPAGQLLDRALADAGIARDQTYVTNAVKNFKFKPAGKRRIHQSPTAGEVKHYRWWLERELEFVQPRLVVALGATATLAMAGKPIPVMKNRGPMRFGAWKGFITVHPSSLLRQPDEAARREGYKTFVQDLERVRGLATT